MIIIQKFFGEKFDINFIEYLQLINLA